MSGLRGGGKDDVPWNERQQESISSSDHASVVPVIRFLAEPDLRIYDSENRAQETYFAPPSGDSLPPHDLTEEEIEAQEREVQRLMRQKEQQQRQQRKKHHQQEANDLQPKFPVTAVPVARKKEADTRIGSASQSASMSPVTQRPGIKDRRTDVPFVGQEETRDSHALPVVSPAGKWIPDSPVAVAASSPAVLPVTQKPNEVASSKNSMPGVEVPREEKRMLVTTVAPPDHSHEDAPDGESLVSLIGKISGRQTCQRL